MNGYDNFNYDGNNDLHRNNTERSFSEGEWNGAHFEGNGNLNNGSRRGNTGKRKRGNSGKFMTVVALAAAFGVTAGGTAYGVNYTAGKLFGGAKVS